MLVETTLAQKILTQTDEEYERSLHELKKICLEIEQSAPEWMKGKRDETICYLAQQLELQGVPKHKIASKVHADCENMNIFCSRSTLYRALGKDYVAAEEMSQLTQNNSSAFTHGLTPNSPEWERRLKLVWFFNEIKARSTRLVEILLSDHDVEFTESGEEVKVPLDWHKFFEPKPDFDEYLSEVQNIFANMRQEFEEIPDGRQKLLAREFVAYTATAGVFNIAATGRNFHANVKATGVVTSKKLSHFFRIFRDQSYARALAVVLEESWKWATIDMPCPNCKDHEPKEQYRYQLGVWCYPEGNYDLHCKNCDKHFDVADYNKRLQALWENRGGAATQYCRKRGIIPEQHELEVDYEESDNVTGSVSKE